MGLSLITFFNKKNSEKAWVSSKDFGFKYNINALPFLHNEKQYYARYKTSKINCWDFSYSNE